MLGDGMILQEKKLIEVIKKEHGKLLAIGVSNDIQKAINKNELITYCDVLNYSSKKGKDGKKGKLFNIKKLRKKYKKNKLDFIIVNYDEVKKFKKTFIKDSVYICSGNIYIINFNEDYNKYNRYNTTIEKNEIIKIDVSKAKTNAIKDKLYYFLDVCEDLVEYISDFLTM